VTGNWPEHSDIDDLIADTDRDMTLVPDPATVTF